MMAWVTHRRLQFSEISYFWIIDKFLENSDLYSTKCFFSLKCTKIVGGWGSAPDPAEAAYSTPPDPLAVMG